MMGFRSLVCLSGIIVTLSALAARPSAGTFPIVSGRNGVIFGGVLNHSWIDVDLMREKIKRGQQYRLYSATKYLGVAKGSAVQEEGGGGPYIEFNVPAGVEESDAVVAVGAPWNALPCVPKAQDVHQPTYQAIVRDLLTRKGLPDAEVNITRLWRIDLEGDGTEEVLINATTLREGFSKEKPYKRGDYSMVLLRKVIKGKIETIPIELNYYTYDAPPNIGWDGVPIINSLQGCFDLNGDGVLEIMTHTDGLPDLWETIYQVNGANVKSVLVALEWI
ncbi:MAG TPA: hypothetical protein VHV83_13170 [Armatimonadota bacterium]|nr:hypothetical protein [Armatimonadota bacterium]